MQEEILNRIDFSDVDMEQTAYLTYEPYKEIPGPDEYVYGKEKTIILRNIATGMLEKIDYVLCGAVPFITRTDYQDYWGEFKSTDDNICYLTFSFKSDGVLEKISASFAGKPPSSSELDDINDMISYGAQVTAVGDFGTIPYKGRTC